MAKLDYFSVFADQRRASVTVGETDSVRSTINSIWADLQAPIKYQLPAASKTWLSLAVLNPPITLEEDGSTLLQYMTTYRGAKTPLQDDALISQHLPDPHHLAFELLLSIPPTAPTAVSVALDNMYRKAWKSEWPLVQHTLRLTLDGDDQMDVEVEKIEIRTAMKQPPDQSDRSQWPYDCILDSRQIADALDIQSKLLPVIVVLKEHVYVWDALLQTRSSYALVGHPGTGKTVLLIMILLLRLKAGLPTAFQHKQHQYILFDESGVSIHAADSKAPGLNADCWALVDSSVIVTVPCEAFLDSPARIIQSASPQQTRWKDWTRVSNARLLITDLPKSIEIATIAKENGFDPHRAISLSRKWGPSIRLVLTALDNPKNSEGPLQAAAVAAGMKLSEKNQATVLRDDGIPSSFGSSLLFLRPIRPLPLDELEEVFDHFEYFIPTDHLIGVFFDELRRASIDKALNLYEALGRHSLTRSAAGFLYEKFVHYKMSYGGTEPLPLYDGSGSTSRLMPPGRQLLAGDLGALKRGWQKTGVFYWMPSSSNFPGVDGILVDSDHEEVYALQVTLANTHRSPADGLENAWATIGAVAARQRSWNFVVVTDDEALMNQHIKSFGAQLCGRILGATQSNHGILVRIFGCLLQAPWSPTVD